MWAQEDRRAGSIGPLVASMTSGVTAGQIQNADEGAESSLAFGSDLAVCKSCQEDYCRQAREKLAQNLKEQEEAMLAGATYGDPDAPLPEGYRRATEQDLQKLGLSDGTTNLLKLSDEPGFNAEAFAKTDPASGAESYVIGFKGTDLTSLSDWSNNLGQGMGNETPYYRRARRIGDRVAQSGLPVSFVGHSLGGGLAATASGASGLPAQTFNAAGLSQATLDRLGLESPDFVRATHVQGDILNGLQDNTPLADAFGTRRAIAPTPELAQDWPVRRNVRMHYMSSVQDSLKQEEEMIRDQMEEKGC